MSVVLESWLDHVCNSKVVWSVALKYVWGLQDYTQPEPKSCGFSRILHFLWSYLLATSHLLFSQHCLFWNDLSCSPSATLAESLMPLFPAPLETCSLRRMSYKEQLEKPFLGEMTEESWQKCYLIQSLSNCSEIRHQESYRAENVAQWCRTRPWILFLAMWKMLMIGQVFQTKGTYKLKTWAIQWRLELKVVWQIWANCSVFNAGRPGWRSHPGRPYKSAKIILRSPEMAGW